MVEDDPGVVRAGPVSAKAPACPRRRLADGYLESGDVVFTQLVQASAGLDEQPGGELRSHVRARPGGEAELFGGRGEARMSVPRSVPAISRFRSFKRRAIR